MAQITGDWKKPNGHWEFVDGAGELLPLLHKRPPAETGDHWGEWVYDAADQTLTFPEGSYAVSLVGLNSAKQVLFWVVHLQRKTWVTSKRLGDFLRALADLVGLEHLAGDQPNQ